MMHSWCNTSVPWSELRLSRRQWLSQLGAGFGTLALSAMLAEDSAAANNPLAVRPPHAPPKAKRVIVLFMFGGPSHLDTFDPKPLLARDSGRPLPAEKRPRVLSFPNRMGNLVGSPFAFRQHGDSGIWLSSLFPHLARRADDLCVINSMHCSNSRHGGAVLEWHTGSDTFVRPSMGSWITYGLGSENQNFPGYVTICQDFSQGGANNFGCGVSPGCLPGDDAGTFRTEAAGGPDSVHRRRHRSTRFAASRARPDRADGTSRSAVARARRRAGGADRVV